MPLYRGLRSGTTPSSSTWAVGAVGVALAVARGLHGSGGGFGGGEVVVEEE